MLNDKRGTSSQPSLLLLQSADFVFQFSVSAVFQGPQCQGTSNRDTPLQPHSPNLKTYAICYRKHKAFLSMNTKFVPLSATNEDDKTRFFIRGATEQIYPLCNKISVAFTKFIQGGNIHQHLFQHPNQSKNY